MIKIIRHKKYIKKKSNIIFVLKYLREENINELNIL